MNISALNPQQKEAVTTIDQPVLLLAGAGTGKTNVVTHRIAYLIQECSVLPEKMLALTFTNKAANEMKERVHACLQKKKSNLTICTFHALGVKILRKYIHLLGYSKNFVIYDTRDQTSVIKGIMDEMLIEDETSLVPKQVLFEIMQAKSKGNPPSIFLQQTSNETSQVVGQIFEEYQTILKNCNAIDFEDILNLSLQLLEVYKDELYELLHQYSYIMVDEYQDTNNTQYKIVKYLIEHTRKLFAVGDDDQSIYSWRGADIRNILDFQTDFPEAKIIRLEQNYRSTSLILKAANQVIQNNSERMSKELWTNQHSEDLIYWVHAQSEQEELEQVIQKIKTQKWKKRALWNQFAFLYRSNHQSRILEEALREEGIAYRVVGGLSFYDRKEIQDCIAYLTFLYNPADEVSLHRIINYPKRGLGTATWMKLNQMKQKYQRTLFQLIENATLLNELNESTIQTLESFVSLIHKYQTLFKESPFYEVAKQLFEELDIEREIEKQEKNKEIATKKINHVREFLNSMYLYGERKKKTDLQSFLEYLSLFTQNDASYSQKEEVSLMTVHAAKGLEFDYIVLPGLIEDQFPNKRALQEGGLEEERRLFYVALTRARKNLFLSCSKSKKIYHETKYNEPSRFVKEIASELFETPPFGTTQNLKKEALRQQAKGDFFSRFRTKTISTK